MGMILHLKRLNDDELASLKANPRLVPDFLYGKFSKDDFRAMPNLLRSVGKQFSKVELARLGTDKLVQNKLKHTIRAELTGRAAAGDREIDIGKAWHGVHWLLAGETWGGLAPLNFILGGENVGDEDVGYGPARAFRSSDVSAIHDALAMINTDQLRARFDPSAMTAAEVYPNVWDRPGESVDWLIVAFETLREFVAEAAKRKEAMMVWIA